MSVAIRLKKMGTKKKLSFRLVAVDSRSPRDGKSIEELGHYNPKSDLNQLALKKDRIEYWLSVGARPTEAAAALLKREGIRSKKA